MTVDAAPITDAMNFELPEEIRMLRDSVRKFVDRELIPIERQARDEKHPHKLKAELRQHLTAKAKEIGPRKHPTGCNMGGRRRWGGAAMARSDPIARQSWNKLSAAGFECFDR